MSRARTGIATVVTLAAAATTGGWLVYAHRAQQPWSAARAGDELVTMLLSRDFELGSVGVAMQNRDASQFAIHCTDLASADLELARKVHAGRWPDDSRYPAQQFEAVVLRQASGLDGCATTGMYRTTIIDTAGAQTALESTFVSQLPGG